MVNRSAGAVIVQQSPTLVSLEAGINLLWLQGGLWNGYLGVAQGVDAFGADRSPLGAERLRPDFRKYRANLLHLRQGDPLRIKSLQAGDLALRLERDVEGRASWQFGPQPDSSTQVRERSSPT